MKKSLLFTIIISVIITICICLVITANPKEKSITYNYDYECSYDAVMDDDEGETSNSISKKMYLKVDNDSYVTEALYESIYDSNVFDKSLEKLTKDVLSLYDDIDGVDTNITKKNKKAIVSIKYNYDKIDYNSLKDNLKEVLDNESLQANMNSKIKVDEYINKSKYYKCQKK